MAVPVLYFLSERKWHDSEIEMPDDSDIDEPELTEITA
jgi:hypothetical protein